MSEEKKKTVVTRKLKLDFSVKEDCESFLKMVRKDKYPDNLYKIQKEFGVWLAAGSDKLKPDVENLQGYFSKYQGWALKKRFGAEAPEPTAESLEEVKITKGSKKSYVGALATQYGCIIGAESIGIFQEKCPKEESEKHMKKVCAMLQSQKRKRITPEFLRSYFD